MSKYEIKASWSGCYPALCCGEWTITINDVTLTDVENSDFNTHNTYFLVYLDEDWCEQHKEYESGLKANDLVKSVLKDDINGLRTSLVKHGFEPTEELLFELYKVINKNDFRFSSCGGCI